jgi:Zn-dependent peptidase ImmA (M78 family)/transcriptional regulator with XRE-family HTH domain
MEVKEMNSIGGRIKSARESARLSQRELAERVPRLDHTALSRIETGRRRVASHELFGLAEALGTTTGNLLGVHEASRSLAVAARLGEVARPEYLVAAVDRVTQVLEMDDLLSRVVGSEQTPSLEVLPHLGGSALSQGQALARAARKALGLGSGAVGGLEALIEDQAGAHVVSQPIEGDVHGICVSDRGISVVLVNSNDSRGRQQFTMAHELGHLLARDLEIYEITGSLTRDDLAEHRAEAFSAYFLAPDEGIRQAVGGRQVSPAVVGELMDYFGMSFEAMSWRLVNVGLISKSDREELRTGSVRAVVDAADVGVRFDQRVNLQGKRQPPRRLLRRVVGAYQRGLVGVGTVAAVLGEPNLGLVRQFLDEKGIQPQTQEFAAEGARLA